MGYLVQLNYGFNFLFVELCALHYTLLKLFQIFFYSPSYTISYLPPKLKTSCTKGQSVVISVFPVLNRGCKINIC